jgi:hypothetical protein
VDYRQSHYDVTNTVKISDPREVGREVCRMLRVLYPDVDVHPAIQAFETFARIYTGTQPGYHGCDTWYHDAQHSLDCTLAMARLICGHDRSARIAHRLGERRAVLGVICALFHDVGYIRRTDESDIKSGGELTLCHVTRSGEFLADFLPTVGFAREAKMAQEMVQYTGYEKPLDQVAVKHARDRRLGFLLGTADLIAQMSDRAYPEKCRSFLYTEFKACGLAGEGKDGKAPVYSSPEDLLRKTPDFAKKLFHDRLDGHFEGAYHYIETYFGGQNPYLAEIRKHLDFIRMLVDEGQLDRLRRQPERIDAPELRKLMGVRLSDARARRPTLPMDTHRTRHATEGEGAEFIPV